VGGKFVPGLQLLGMSADALAKLPAIDPADAEKALDAINSIRSLRWSIVQRGFWANGSPDLPSFLVEMWKWKLTPEELAQIRCPTLVTWGQSDRASTNAKDLYDALTCPKELLQFTDADGAGMHCEMLNRSMASRQILDSLDETLGVTALT
jgi:pimeloyl-ACP methyl ester carboxylesterase